MKKMIVLFLSVCLLTLCLSGCGNGKNNKNSGDPKLAYRNLNEVSEQCDLMAAGIGAAWHWSIYEDKHTASSLAGEVYVDVSTLEDAYETVTGDTYFDYKTQLGDFSTAVTVTQQAYIDAGYFNQTEATTLLAEAKSNISSLSGDEPYYNDLKNYYTAVSNYFDFCCSPSGSYNDYGATVSGYQNNISTLKSNLSFDLE